MSEHIHVHVHDAGTGWMEVRREMYEKLTVGKTYSFDGRIGKVSEKSESAGKNAAGIEQGGKPMVKVAWR